MESSVLRALSRAVQSSSLQQIDDAQLEAAVQQHFEQLTGTAPSSRKQVAIPQFFARKSSNAAPPPPPPPPPSSSQQQVESSVAVAEMEPDTVTPLYKRVARAQQLEIKGAELLSREQFEKLLQLLLANQTAENSNTISYKGFCKVADDMRAHLSDEQYEHLFKSSLFCKFASDEHGYINVWAYFNYVMRRISYIQTRMRLELHDSHGHGTFTEVDLENFIYEVCNKIPHLQQIEQEFLLYYVITAVRKFFFFLDPTHRSKINVRDIVTSPILDELLMLKDDTIQESELRRNWFSLPSAVDVYTQYLTLDVDKDGMLSREEFGNVFNGSFTSTFIDRMFQELPTFSGSLDYKMFLDFALACRYKQTPESIRYFWQFLDLKKDGKLTAFTINYFFREVAKTLQAMVMDSVPVEDIKDEIFDMVKPENPLYLTLPDLLNCGVGHIVIDMLSNAHAFWEYDTRESSNSLSDEVEEEQKYLLGTHPPPLDSGPGTDGDGSPPN